MSTVCYRGEPIEISGKIPCVGDKAPFFMLVDKDITDLTLDDFKGKNVIINIFSSIHIPECAQSIRDFNLFASRHRDITFLCISADLPLSMREFCQREGLDYIQGASFFRNNDFTDDYGVAINSGFFKGLSTPTVIGINDKGIICYSKRAINIDNFYIYPEAIHSLNTSRSQSLRNE